MNEDIRKRIVRVVACYMCVIALPLMMGACSSDEKEYDDVVEEVWDVANKNPDGFTLNLSNMFYVQKGIVVAYSETQNSFGKDCLPKVISIARKHANVVGGWLDTESGNYYFDADTIFSEDDIEAAKAFGVSQKQLAIYVLSKDSTIYLGKVTKENRHLLHGRGFNHTR